jgi:sodium transport system permease protein
MKSSLQRIAIVCAKEIQDNLRDRRSMISAMVNPLLGPVIIVIMVVIVGKAFFNEVHETALKLPVVGAENAPSLVHFLEQNNVEIIPGPENPEEKVRNGDLDIVLIIPEDYGQNFSSGVPSAVQLVMDSSRQSALATIERARLLLNQYNSQISGLRLLARGINPSVVSPLAIENLDVATPQTQVLIFLNTMPYFIILVIFVGGMHVIIDATAGERDRGSLEPLLINPVRRRDLVLGKLIASLPFVIFALIINLLAFAIAFNAFPLEDFVGFQLTIDLGALFKIFLLALPMTILASALQMIIATYARSFKEAQTYTGLLPLIPALPGIGLAFLPVKPSAWVMAIPTFGQQVLINQIMRNEPTSVLNILISTASTLALSVILIYFAIKLYQRERIMMGSR